jgi:hypothetical protein
MNRCPYCGSTFVRLVRPRFWQVLRFRFSPARPHACWHCGWEGWLPLEDAGVGAAADRQAVEGHAEGSATLEQTSAPPQKSPPRPSSAA